MSSSFPPAAPVTSDSQRALQASLGKLRQSASRLRISVGRMEAALPKCCTRETHEAIKASEVLWNAQELIGYTNAEGCSPKPGEAIGGVMKNCVHCGSTMFLKGAV